MIRLRLNAGRLIAAALGLVVVLGVSTRPVAETAQATSSGTTYPEQQGHYGVDTFLNPHDASGKGPRIEPGQWVEVSCKVYAPEIQSANPDGYWYRIASSPWDNQYYAPANTFMNGDPWDVGGDTWTDVNVPDCSAGGVAAPQPAIPNDFYNRSAAVRWALDHARDDQTVSAMCTWFVSNALWNGGFSRSDMWTDAGSHGTVQQRPGSVAAWAVPEFLDYIQGHFETVWTPLGLLTDQNNAVPAAEPGDIIAYDWGHGDGISHLALVVSISDGSYPNVAEWGQGDWILPFHPYTSPYQSRGWTWSEKHHDWLQAVNGGTVQAYLLHINGGHFVDNF